MGRDWFSYNSCHRLFCALPRRKLLGPGCLGRPIFPWVHEGLCAETNPRQLTVAESFYQAILPLRAGVEKSLAPMLLQGVPTMTRK